MQELPIITLYAVITCTVLNHIRTIDALSVRYCSLQENERDVNGGLYGKFATVMGRYFLVSNTSKSWGQARQVCRNLRSHSDLVMFRDKQEDIALNDESGLLLDENNFVGYWIGLRRREQGDEYYWMDRSDNITHDWWDRFAQGRPPNRSDGDHLCVTKRLFQWKFATKSCSTQRYFICQYNPIKYIRRFELPQEIMVEPNQPNHDYGTSVEVSCQAYTKEYTALSMSVSSKKNPTPVMINDRLFIVNKSLGFHSMRSHVRYLYTPEEEGAVCAQNAFTKVVLNITEYTEDILISCCLHGHCINPGFKFNVLYYSGTPELDVAYLDRGADKFVVILCEAFVGSGGFMTIRVCPTDSFYDEQYWLINKTGGLSKTHDSQFFQLSDFDVDYEKNATEGLMLSASFTLRMSPALEDSRVACYSERVSMDMICASESIGTIAVKTTFPTKSKVEDKLVKYDTEIFYGGIGLLSILVLVILLSAVRKLCSKKKPEKTNPTVPPPVGEAALDETSYRSETESRTPTWDVYFDGREIPTTTSSYARFSSSADTGEIYDEPAPPPSKGRRR